MHTFDPLDLLRRKDRTWRVDPSLLYPPFLERLLLVLTRAHERGEDYYLTSGLRWYAEQEELHRRHLAGGPRAVAAGYSAHQYGIAVDGAPDKDEATPGLQGPDYSSAAYATLIEEARRAGLKPGADFGDNPHVQVPQFVTRSQLAALRVVFVRERGDQAAKLRAVWAYLDRHLVLAPLAA